ncbi:MAG: hypothetical protein EXR79_06055 [Myxococcales bacterium]|nr:hypothetical protein [Myxococcales bacterium]
MTLAELVQSDAPIDQVGQWLDGLDHGQRWAAATTLGRAQQRTLYEKAAQAPAIDLRHFVAASVADTTQVIHHGWNTLPLPAPLRRFQKRFCRPPREAERLFGYNEGLTRGIVGPGHFVAVPTTGNLAWSERGAVVVDYFQVADGAIPAGWPAVVPNSQGLQRIVYFQTRDFMRRISRHVSIGAAYKVEKPLGHFFLLVRED